MRGMKIPRVFRAIVEGFGSAEAKAPAWFGDEQRYVDCWDNDWLIEKLYGQWKYVHAKSVGKEPAKAWFFSWDGQSPFDWKSTAMHIMNAEYSGNAAYEWFGYELDENGTKQMCRINQFDRIESTDDPRLYNPALDYLFSHPEMTVAAAFREFKQALVEKKN